VIRVTRFLKVDVTAGTNPRVTPGGPYRFL